MAKNRSSLLTEERLKANPHYVYHNHMLLISKCVASERDPSRLVNTLWAMTAHYHDRVFNQEWDDIHGWTPSEEPSEDELGGFEMRMLEYAALVRMMSRRGLIEEVRAVDVIGRGDDDEHDDQE